MLVSSGVWGGAPAGSAQRKILASFGGLEAISVRKRHYQFGKPRPPNWAFFLLNILLLTQKKACSRSLNNINFFLNGGIITASKLLFMAGLPPISAKMSQNGGSNSGSNPFFSLRGGVLRVSGWCGAPHRRGAARKEKFSHQKRTFTPHFAYKKWVIRS